MSRFRLCIAIASLCVSFSANVSSPVLAASASQFNRAFQEALKRPHTMSKDCAGPICVAEVKPIGAKWRLVFAKNTETGAVKRFFCTKSCEEVH